jgi:hypothetical protein
MAENEAVVLLRSIDDSLKAIVRMAKEGLPKRVATDADLDGPHGDPVLTNVPRDWTGGNFKGLPLSSCPPELLDLAVEQYEYWADKAEANKELTSSGKPRAFYNRADAARARGWARRLRAGWVRPTRPATAAPPEFSTDAGDFDEPPPDAPLTADDIGF